MVKNPAANAGDVDSIPDPGRSPGEGNGNPLQCSCLENPMDRGAWWATVHGRVTKESDMPEGLKNNTDHHNGQYRIKKMNHTHKDKSSRRTNEGKATPRIGWSGPQRVGQAGSLMTKRDFQLGD